MIRWILALILSSCTAFAIAPRQAVIGLGGGFSVPSAGPGFAQVQKVSNATTANSANLTATYGVTPIQNDLLIACSSSDSTLTMSSSGWTLVTSNVSSQGQYMWYKIAGSSEPTTVTVAIGGGSDSAVTTIFEYSGMLTTGVLDVFSTSLSAGASGTTATLAQPNELVIAFICWNFTNFATTATALSNSYVIEDQPVTSGSAQNIKHVVGSLSTSGTAAQSTTATFSGSTTSTQGIIATFKKQ